jgi:secreted trypsin-like serine protease
MGDSGSALAIKLRDRWVLRGVVSAATSESCNGESAVLYTDVAQFRDWINGFTEKRWVKRCIAMTLNEIFD